MAVYGRKMLDKNGNTVLPKTRSKVVYMDNNQTLQDAWNSIMSGSGDGSVGLSQYLKDLTSNAKYGFAKTTTLGNDENRITVKNGDDTEIIPDKADKANLVKNYVDGQNASIGVLEFATPSDAKYENKYVKMYNKTEGDSGEYESTEVFPDTARNATALNDRRLTFSVSGTTLTITDVEYPWPQTT